jgi:hypothetical protein
MRYERVHVVWDLYDGVRTGIADLGSAPHYFASQFDEGADDYSDNFKLYPVRPEFKQRAMRNWASIGHGNANFITVKLILRHIPATAESTLNTTNCSPGSTIK